MVVPQKMYGTDVLIKHMWSPSYNTDTIAPRVTANAKTC